MPARKSRSPKEFTPPRKYRARIRMYRHGLGDSFLLSFPKSRGAGHFHVLIDCGVVLGTVDPRAIMRAVAEDIREATRAKPSGPAILDALVITHEHWDHLSAFDAAQARSIFEDVQIKSLWLAWTEEQGNPLADELRTERAQKKKAAKIALQAFDEIAQALPDGKQAQHAQRLSELLGLFGTPAAGGDDPPDSGTAGALEFVKRAVHGKAPPKILKPGDTLSPSEVKGLRIFVLGPPLNKKDLKEANPSQGEGYALTEPPIGLADAFLLSFDDQDERAQPFDSRYRLPLASLRNMPSGPTPADAQSDPGGVFGYYDKNREWRNIDHDWLGTGARLALQLDNATNNTSLVLAFELDDGDVLLFVGDAQAGSWRSWSTLEWTVKDASSEKRRVTSADLLGRTIFYKVGHHGSHNATMRDSGLELMRSPNLAAVIPVDSKVAQEVKGWKHMPLPAICKRLEEKCAVVFKSDAPTISKEGVAVRWVHSEKTFAVKMKDKTTKKPKTVGTRPLYTDYYV